MESPNQTKYTVTLGYSLIGDAVYRDVVDWRVLDGGVLRFTTSSTWDGDIGPNKTIVASPATRWQVVEQRDK